MAFKLPVPTAVLNELRHVVLPGGTVSVISDGKATRLLISVGDAVLRGSIEDEMVTMETAQAEGDARDVFADLQMGCIRSAGDRVRQSIWLLDRAVRASICSEGMLREAGVGQAFIDAARLVLEVDRVAS